MLENIMSEIVRNRIIPEPVSEWKPLKGGTESTVGVIGTIDRPNRYVVKTNSAERVKAETRFYSLYAGNPLLPAVRYVDPDFRYFIYDFVPGETCYDRSTKQALLSELADRMIRHYVRPASSESYEWVEDPRHDQDDIRYIRSVVDGHLADEEHDRVKLLYDRRSRRISSGGLYVLHGDFGVHNFLFEQGKLAGVIDPIPVAGRKLHDLLYAFCSSPDDLHLPVLLQAVRQLDEGPIDRDGLIEDTIMSLYSRMATCLRHHPEDLPLYLRAWGEWMQLT